MASLEKLEIFTRVAEARSFSRAARDLGISKGTTSKAVAALERELGTQLLARSSRTVSVTEAGRLLMEGGRAVLDEADRAERRVRELRDTPAGTVRVNTSTGVAASWLAPALGAFLRACPRVSVVLDADDARVDALHGGYDVILRMGPLGDSSLRARRLGSFAFVCVAAPSYLAAAGTPQKPDELVRHSCVTLGTESRPERWTFYRRGTKRTVTVTSRLETSSDVVARQALLGGAGVGVLPAFMAEADLAAGTLVALLPGWERPAVAVHALFAGTIPAKVRSFLDFLTKLLA